MSLILSYIGTKGCVMVGDKRKIAYFGDKTNRIQLEDELYNGHITNNSQLKNRAKQLNISLKITDDNNKIRGLTNVLIGEVNSKSPIKTKRKRIYCTTYGYQIVELIGSNISKVEKGEPSVVVFGNIITKKMAHEIIQKKWPTKTSLVEIGNLFQETIKEISKHTPAISQESDILIKNPNVSKDQAQKLLRETILRDIRLLQKWREKLDEDLLEANNSLNSSAKIINNGSIGRVYNIRSKMLEIILNKNIQAFNTNWKLMAKGGEKILMYADKGSNAHLGDEIVIENENLYIKRNKKSLHCDLILCEN